MKNIGLIGKKLGMSREFIKTGQSVPVTILKMETGRIIHIIDNCKSISNHNLCASLSALWVPTALH